jgi:molybdopterin molybdotransferase
MIRYMLGLTPQLPMKKARLESKYVKKSSKTEVAVGNLAYHDNHYTINFKGKRAGTSAIMTNMLGDTALLMIKKESADIDAGEWVDFIDMSGL